jgi:hypothetical protein
VEEGGCAAEGEAGKKRAKDIAAQVEELPAQEVLQEVEDIPIEAPTLVRPAKNPKGSKVPSKTRRKLQLDDELETLPKPKKKAPKSEGVEDTFIFGLKPKKRQPKSKSKKTIEEEEPIHEETESAPAPSKKNRSAKAKQQANVRSCETSTGELDQDVVVLEGIPMKVKGKTRTDALPTEMDSSEKAPPPAAVGFDTTKETLLESHQVETKQPRTAPKATKPKATTKKASKRTIEDVVENETATAPEPTAKRPRRQAAISATVKVTQGYEEELVPADKLRRAPEPVAKRGRPKKMAVAEDSPVLPLSPPPSTLKPASGDVPDCGENEVPVAKARSVGRPRKLGAKSAKVDIAATEREPVATSSRLEGKKSALEDLHQVAEAETPVQEAPPVKRARKVRAHIVIQDVSTDDEPAKEIREIKQERSRASKAPPLETNRKAASKAVESVNVIDEKLAAVEEVFESLDIVIPVTQGSHYTNINSQYLDQTTRSRGDKMAEPKTKSRRALAEADVNIVRSLPPDDLEAIVKPATAKRHRLDEVTAKPASKDVDTERARKKQSSRKTKLVHDVNPTVEREDGKHTTVPTPDFLVEITHTKRGRKAQLAQQSKPTPNIEPPHDEPTVPKKRHVIAADEDLDWLFEKCENKRSRAPARNPCASSKVNRQAPVKKSADAKDMDLDDLLESIAGFSGKLLTGKSGRTMASR